MPEGNSLRIHDFLPYSRSNGPGIRAVLWVQGCTLGCPGCFNPQTHSVQAGSWMPVGSLVEKITSLAGQVQGVTISGGEPFQQTEALTALCRGIRLSSGLSILVFTGFEMQELVRLPGSQEALRHLDVLIAGRYRQEFRLARSLRGSLNKKIYFMTDRYSAEDFESLTEAEVFISQDGEITLSGIDPLKFHDSV